MTEPVMSPKHKLRKSYSGFNAAGDRVAVEILKRGEELFLTKKLVAAIIAEWRNEIWSNARDKGRFHWPGLGVFVISRRKARRVRLPPPGVMADGTTHVLIPESWSLSLRASKTRKGRGHGPV
jgi:nucleoid DNA-binding protein